MERIIRVAYLCEFPTLLGGERSMLAFLEQRAFAGIEPLVICPSEGTLADAVDQMRIPREGWPKGGKKSVGQLADALNDWGIDLVHANSLMTCPQALELGDRLSIPALGHVRDVMSLSAEQAARLNRMSAVVAVSNFVRDWLIDQGVHSERVVRIYNGVDGERLKKNSHKTLLRDELQLADGVPIIGCVGQICLRKGQDIFLQAAKLIAQRHADVQFVLLGARYSQKEESREFESRLRGEGEALSNRVHFLGYRTNGPELISGLDILVSASRQEPLSRSILEAMASGVAVVATDVGGTREILAAARVAPDRGTVGRLVPKDDAAAMAAAVCDLLEDNASRAFFRTVGPTILRDRFSLDVHVRTVRGLYDAVLGDDPLQ